MSKMGILVTLNLACWAILSIAVFTFLHPPSTPSTLAGSGDVEDAHPLPPSKPCSQPPPPQRIAQAHHESATSNHGTVIFSPSHPLATSPQLPYIVNDLKRQQSFLGALHRETRDALATTKVNRIPAPVNELEDLTMSDSKTNFLEDGSFHLILYHPSPARCERAMEIARHSPPVDCSTFKGDTCNIYKEYFSSSSHPKLLKAREGRKMTFVEIGGLDGAPDNSMTEIMERNGWDGLVIEATPSNYVQIANNRPCVSSLEAAAGESWERVNFFGWGGCCSGMKAGMSDGFVKAFHKKGSAKDRRYYKVRSAPIGDIFLAWGKTFVDFWVLDVEGAERFVLRGMDFEAIGVGMIMVETGGGKSEGAREVDSILVKEGFFKVKGFESWNDLNSLYMNSKVWSTS